MSRFLCNTGFHSTMIRNVLRNMRITTSPKRRDRWYHEKKRPDRDEAQVPHKGCDTGELPPWHEECKVYDV
jgi:hypothetical protein